MSGSSGGYCPICDKSYGPEANGCPVHGFLFQSRDALRPDKVIDGTYKILRRLGAGGMGETYLVHHPYLGENLVLKRIRPELAEDPLYQQSFLREAHSLAALRKLPAVVEIRNAWQTREGYLALLLEYIEGGNLLQWLDTARGGGPLEPLEAVAIAADLARVLAAAHAIGVLHRDVKPQNILMRGLEGGGFQLKLCDFGLAVQRMEEMTQQGTTTTRLGTPGYAAPEQYTLSSREQDARVDIFGLGMTLYRLAAGRLPWEASAASWPLVCRDQPRKSLKELRPALGKEYWLESLLLRMTAVERNDRIATAAEALELMQEALAETRPAVVAPLPHMTLPPIDRQPPPRPPRVMERNEAVRQQAEEEEHRRVAEIARQEAEQRAQAELKRRAEEEAQRQQAEEEERRRAAEIARQEAEQRAQAELKRRAEEEAQRQQAEEEERHRVAEIARQEAEQRAQAELKRRGEEKAQRQQAEEEERHRIAEIARQEAEQCAQADLKRRAEEEAQRQQAEEEERHRAAEIARQAVEQPVQAWLKRRAEEEAQRQQAEEEERHRLAEIARQAAEQRAQVELKRDSSLHLTADYLGNLVFPDRTVFVDSGVTLTGDVSASSVHIFGTVRGNAFGEKLLEIHENGKLIGALTTTRIKIADSAYFKGSINIIKAEKARPQHSDEKSRDGIGMPHPDAPNQQEHAPTDTQVEDLRKRLLADLRNAELRREYLSLRNQEGSDSTAKRNAAFCRKQDDDIDVGAGWGSMVGLFSAVAVPWALVSRYPTGLPWYAWAMGGAAAYALPIIFLYTLSSIPRALGVGLFGGASFGVLVSLPVVLCSTFLPFWPQAVAWGICSLFGGLCSYFVFVEDNGAPPPPLPRFAYFLKGEARERYLETGTVFRPSFFIFWLLVLAFACFGQPIFAGLHSLFYG